MEQVALVQVEPDWDLELLAPAVAENVAAEETQQRAQVDGILDYRRIAIATGGVERGVLREQAGDAEQDAGEEGRGEGEEWEAVMAEEEVGGVDEEEDDVVGELLKEGEVALDNDEQRERDEAADPVVLGGGVDEEEEDGGGEDRKVGLVALDKLEQAVGGAGVGGGAGEGGEAIVAEQVNEGVGLEQGDGEQDEATTPKTATTSSVWSSTGSA